MKLVFYATAITWGVNFILYLFDPNDYISDILGKWINIPLLFIFAVFMLIKLGKEANHEGVEMKEHGPVDTEKEYVQDIMDTLYAYYGTGTGCLFGLKPEQKEITRAIVIALMRHFTIKPIEEGD